MLPSGPELTEDARIRVMFLVPSLTVGGAERHVIHLVRMLDPERYATMVCCISEQGALYEEAREAGAEVMSLDSRMRQAPSAMLKLVRAMRRFRPDVVITRGFNAETLGRSAAAIARVPSSVVWKHNCGDLKRRLRTRVADRLLDPVTDHYFGVAFGQVPYLVNDLGLKGSKIRIIRNGVDPEAHTRITDEARLAEIRGSLGLEATDRVVGILAVLRTEKDHATFLRAGRAVIDRMPQARLLVVGDGPRREELEALSAELGLGDRVIFAGMRSDVGDLLSVIDVVVLSSFTIECFPFAVLEAMSASVPAVCTAIGGLPELVEDGVTGYLVPPRDPQGLADGILRVLEPEGRAAEMGAAARLRLQERFTLERSITETERVLESIVVGSGRR